MKISLKYLLIIVFSISLQACTMLDHDLYHSRPGKTATLTIDLPSPDYNNIRIYHYDETASQGKKIWDGGIALIYGSDGFSTKALNKVVTINANKPFNIEVDMDTYNSYCQLKVSFVPVAGQTYRLKSGRMAPTTHKSFFDSVFTGIDYGRCYVAVHKIENGKLIPIDLENIE